MDALPLADLGGNGRRCSMLGCRRTRAEAIAQAQTWHLAEAYLEEPQRLSVHAWGSACAEHAAELLDALEAEAQPAERFRVTLRRLEHPDPGR